MNTNSVLLRSVFGAGGLDMLSLQAQVAFDGCSLILVGVSSGPGKPANHPLSAAWSGVLMGGAPRHL